LLIWLCQGKCLADPSRPSRNMTKRWACRSLPGPVGFTPRVRAQLHSRGVWFTNAARGRLPFVSPHRIFHQTYHAVRGLGSRVVSVLDSGAEGPPFQIAAATLSGNSLRQTVHTHCASVHQAAKLVADLLRVAGVTAGLVESNGSLPPGL